MDKPARTNAKEVISGFLGVPISEADHRFELSRTPLAVYRIEDVYYCAPPSNARPCAKWDWKALGRVGNRDIFCASSPPDHLR